MRMRWTLAVCGAGATVAIPHYVLYLHERMIDVHVAMTRTATRFVAKEVLETFSGRKVFVDLFDRDGDIQVPHIDLGSKVDAVVVLPATANIISKAAHGLADDLVSSIVLFSVVPVFFVPALNEEVSANTILLRNLSILREAGHFVIEQTSAPSIKVASGKRQERAMPTLDEIVEQVAMVLEQKPRETAS